jgi:glycosyltransferase involved in cell wall biosynthesis
VLPLRVRRLRPDVFHGPHYTLPVGLPCPAVVTFHDPTFFSLPHLHERSKVAYFTRTARTGIKRAARVIAVSEYAKQGAITFAGAEGDRVDVVHGGVDLHRYRPEAPSGLRAPYILFVGTLEPRKDVPTLIAAYGELDTPHELVLAGQPGWGMREIEQAIAAARRTTIRLAGFVSEDEKLDLYRNASAFVYPSIAEGFGLPMLEAMACGAPVITTTGSAPEEIAGDAAVLVPPQNVTALREALHRLLSDETYAADLRRRGVVRAQRYTWEAAAARTVDVWRRGAERR